MERWPPNVNKEKKLQGLNVVLFESRHAKTLADLVRLQGGNPISAPSMKEVPIENNPEALKFGELLFEGKIDLLILLTGVGARTLLLVLERRYPKDKVLAAFKTIPIVPRGPKPIRALNEWGVPYALTVPEPNTWHEILKTLDDNQAKIPLKGKTVAVQEYGVANIELLEGLEKMGAKVLRVPVYRWALPDDLGPIQSAISQITEGNVQVAVFTTAVQSDHVFKVAEQMKKAAALKKAFEKVVVASIGPDCTQALVSHGLKVDLEPESSKMGPLIVAVADRARNLLAQKI